MGFISTCASRRAGDHSCVSVLMNRTLSLDTMAKAIYFIELPTQIFNLCFIGTGEFRRAAGNWRITAQPRLSAKGRLRPTKRLTNKVIDGGLGISYLSFELDDFSLSLCPQLAGCVSSIRRSEAVVRRCQASCPFPSGQAGKAVYPQILWINL